MSRRELLARYAANLEAARNKEAAADAAFLVAMNLPWWRPWETSRLLNQSQELRHQAVLLYEDNVTLAFEIEGQA